MGIEREYKGPENLLNFEESQKQKEERHKREEGEHIKQFMDMQIAVIKIGHQSYLKINLEISLDDYVLNIWQPNYSTKFREIFREERDAEENAHLDIWEEMKEDNFRKILIQKMIERLYKDNPEKDDKIESLA